MKKTKKIVSLWCVVLMISSMFLCIPASALSTQNFLEADNYAGNVVVTNEYLEAKKLASESSSSLMRKGYTTQDINEIRNYKDVFLTHVKSLNQLSDVELKGHGYSDDQIMIIRNFTGTEEELIRASATFSFTVNITNYTYDGTRTYATVNWSFAWTGLPALATKAKDIIAAGWNDYLVVSNSSTIRYFKETNSDYVSQESATLKYGNLLSSGAAHTFSARKNIGGFDVYARNGYGSISVKSDAAEKKDFVYTVEYGQNRLIAEPSFSILGGPDISFSINVVTIGEYDGVKSLESL